MHNRLVRALSSFVVVGALAFAVGGCAASGGTGADDAPTGDAGGALTGTLKVSAAASLAGAFEEISTAFAAQNPGVEVAPIAYDGSSTLATQIVEGAPADVFAAANQATMQRVVSAGRVEQPVDVARNTLVLVTPPGNPAGIAGLDDLAEADTIVVLCAREVPCGAASEQLLQNAGVELTPASNEQNVTAVLTKVDTGEADAGLVYATDVPEGATDLEVIVPEGADEVVNVYSMAALTDAAYPGVAAAFVEYVAGPEGQAILRTYGFAAAS